MNKVYKRQTRRKRLRTKHKIRDIKRTRKLKKGGGLLGMLGMDYKHYKENDILNTITPYLVHGKIITREQIMLRILTIVFIQLIRTDLIDHYDSKNSTSKPKPPPQGYVPGFELCVQT